MFIPFFSRNVFCQFFVKHVVVAYYIINFLIYERFAHKRKAKFLNRPFMTV